MFTMGLKGLILAPCVMILSLALKAKACYMDRDLTGTWKIYDDSGNDPKGVITFQNSGVRVTFEGKDYGFQCAAKDFDGKYLLKTADEKKMLCVMLNSWDQSSIAMIKMNAGHFATSSDFFEAMPIPSGYTPTIDSCDEYTGDIMLFLHYSSKI